jgi:hypothetical protein
VDFVGLFSPFHAHAMQRVPLHKGQRWLSQEYAGSMLIITALRQSPLAVMEPKRREYSPCGPSNLFSYIAKVGVQYPFAFPNSGLSARYLFVVLFVDIDDLLDFVVTAQEDTRSVVDVLWDNFKHSLHLAVDRLPASWRAISTAN